MIRIIILCLTLLLIGCGGPGVAAYHKGNEAYQYGNYKESFANYLYAANEGVIPAEYNLAYQYFYGQGTKRDQVRAIRWLQCASHHSLRARYALYLIQEKRPDQPWTLNLTK